MDQKKWFNQMQPQTLQFACILLYLNAVFGLFYFLRDPLEFISMIGAAAAFGIANDRKWGWYLALGVAVLNTLLVLLFPPAFFYLVVSLMFRVLLVVLLLHPMTRSYQKLWFK